MIADEDIVQVRERCNKMIAAVEAAGGNGALEEARKALLAAVFKTHPKLDAWDLETFLSLRVLVSDTGNGERPSCHYYMIS